MSPWKTEANSYNVSQTKQLLPHPETCLTEIYVITKLYPIFIVWKSSGLMATKVRYFTFTSFCSPFCWHFDLLRKAPDMINLKESGERGWLPSPETGQQSARERIECSMSRLVVCRPSQRLPTYPGPHSSLVGSLCQGAHATALRLIPQNCACVSVCAWLTFRLLHCHLCWHRSVYRRGTVPEPSVADDSLYPSQYVGLVNSHRHARERAHMHTRCSD